MLVQPRPGPVINRVLAALDPMHAWGKPESLDGTILEAARTVSGLYKAELHVGHAMEPLPALLEQHMGEGQDAVSEARREFMQTQQKALAAACEESGIDSAHVHQREGTPERVIPDIVGDVGADLLVLGTVNRRGLKRAVIGSTAEAILDRVACDVLAVKPDGFVSDYEKLKDE
jgi:universal stress protein E